MGTVKTVPVGVDTVIHGGTGEILAQKVITRDVLVKDSEEWLSAYAQLVRSLFKLNGNEVKVMFWCALNVAVNTNEIALPRVVKDRMSRETGLTVGSIENALGGLVAKKLMKRPGRGVYHLDPDATWRGDLKARAKNVQVFLNYKIEKP